MSLRDLTKGFPSSSDMEGILEEIAGSSDRSAAIVLSSLVETALYLVLRSRLIDHNDLDSFFEGATAPFQTFSSRIKLGRALGIYGTDTTRTLGSIREIRNIFAHALRRVDFDTLAIRSKCETLSWPSHLTPRDSENYRAMRKTYTTACTNLAIALAKEAADFKRPPTTNLK